MDIIVKLLAILIAPVCASYVDEKYVLLRRDLARTVASRLAKDRLLNSVNMKLVQLKWSMQLEHDRAKVGSKGGQLKEYGDDGLEMHGGDKLEGEATGLDQLKQLVAGLETDRYGLEMQLLLLKTREEKLKTAIMVYEKDTLKRRYEIDRIISMLLNFALVVLFLIIEGYNKKLVRKFLGTVLFCLNEVIHATFPIFEAHLRREL